MNLNHIGLLLVLFLILCSPASAQRISCDELADVLDVRAWRVPMPKDKRFEWSIELVDYAQHKSVRLNSEKFSRREKALIALRGTGKNSFEFTLKNRAGTSQGDLEIDLCSEIEKKANRCDNSYSITWHNPAEPYGDGTKLLIADIIGERSRKQIVLELAKFRLEDILEDKPSAQSSQANKALQLTAR
jgi:hypothetical protein